MSNYTPEEQAAYWKKKAMAGGGKPTKKYSKKYGARPKTYKKNYYAENLKAETRAANKTSRAGWQAGGSIAGAAIGGGIFGPAGIAAGGAIGSMVGDGIASLMGYGKYTIKKNSLLTEMTSGKPPSIMNKDKNGGTMIRNREYVGDIISHSTPGAFKLQSFPINPGLSDTFPLLSEVASAYEQYSLEGVIFEFRSMSGSALNSVNTALGQVIMSTNYNADSPNFTSKQAMENYEYGQSCNPSQSMIHPIECARSQSFNKILFTRSGAVVAGQDKILYDWGNFQIATNGLQGGSVNVGELWVSYQWRGYKLRMYQTLGLGIQYAHYRNNAYTNSNPLGSGVFTVSTDTIGLAIVVGAILGFPSKAVIQTYMIDISWIGTSAAITQPTLTFAGGLASAGLVVAAFTPVTGETSAQSHMQYTVTTAANSVGTLTFSAAVLPSAGTTFEMFVVQMPNGATLIEDEDDDDRYTAYEPKRFDIDAPPKALFDAQTGERLK